MKIIFLTITIFIVAFLKAQNTFDNLKDTGYLTSFCVLNDTVYLIGQNYDIERFNTGVFFKGLVVRSSTKKQMLKTTEINLIDTILTSHEIVFYQNNLLAICSYENPKNTSKGIALFYLNKDDLKVNKIKYYSLNEYKNFNRITTQYGIIDCIIKEDHLIGFFTADTILVESGFKTKTRSVYPVLFKINLNSDTIKTKELYYKLPSKSFGLVSLSDSILQFYTRYDLGNDMINFNTDLVITKIENKFQYYDTFTVGVLENFISAVRVNNNTYLAGTTDTIYRFNGKKVESRFSITKMDNENNVDFRKSFYDKTIDLEEGYSKGYYAADKNSIYFYNNKFYVVYISADGFISFNKNNKMYLKVLDINLNIIAEKEFSVPNFGLNAVSIEVHNNICYILGNIKSANFIKPYLMEISLDSLSSSIIEKDIDKISIYPNPATSKLNLVFEGNIPKNLIVNIYDSKGSLVKSETLSDNEINTTNLAQGLYLLTIEAEGKRYSSKFIKE